MATGALTQYIDVAQIVLYVFWIFFAGLIVYLRREDKREGYPLESDRSGRVRVQGFPAMPAPKVFRLRNGATYAAPPGNADHESVRAVPAAAFPGAPLQPTGDPMLDAVGPAAYANRENTPDLTAEGEAKIVPLRVARDFHVAANDPDPRGMRVLGADGNAAGVVHDLWVDRSEPQIRYLEVELSSPSPGRRVLLPIGFARIGRRGQVRVASILASQFADVPDIGNPDRITLREEDRICGYFAGGHLYAEPSRMGPIL